VKAAVLTSALRGNLTCPPPVTHSSTLCPYNLPRVLCAARLCSGGPSPDEGSYELPDGNVLKLSGLRQTIPELLFSAEATDPFRHLLSLRSTSAWLLYYNAGETIACCAVQHGAMRSCAVQRVLASVRHSSQPAAAASPSRTAAVLRSRTQRCAVGSFASSNRLMHIAWPYIAAHGRHERAPAAPYLSPSLAPVCVSLSLAS
jgi:hypothetical protein